MMVCKGNCVDANAIIMADDGPAIVIKDCVLVVTLPHVPSFPRTVEIKWVPELEEESSNPVLDIPWSFPPEEVNPDVVAGPVA